jgi:hypothetical protein
MNRFITRAVLLSACDELLVYFPNAPSVVCQNDISEKVVSNTESNSVGSHIIIVAVLFSLQCNVFFFFGEKLVSKKLASHIAYAFIHCYSHCMQSVAYWYIFIAQSIR